MVFNLLSITKYQKIFDFEQETFIEFIYYSQIKFKIY